MFNTKQILREELILNNKKSLLSENSLKLIGDYNHVNYVLGIQTPLNENYSLELRKRIIEEQLIYETVIDSIKTFLKDKYNKTAETIRNVYDIIVLIKDIIIKPEKLQIARNMAKKFLNNKLKLLTNKIKTAIDKIKIVNITEYLNNFLDKIKNIISNVINYDGWKGFVLITGFNLLLEYVSKTFINPLLNKIEYFYDKNFIKNFSNKMNLFKELNSIVPNLMDIKEIFNWFNKIGMASDIITNVYTPIADKISYGDELMKSINKTNTN